ncbi:unnamed protein product [Sphagnum tenellum]
MIPVGGLQMAKRSYSCSGSSNGNNNADHLRRRATHGNGSASSSDGEDDHDSMRPRKLLKSNGLQLRNAENFISWAALIVQLTILCYICREHKILGIPTLDNGAPASLEEAQADGDDHENGYDRSEADGEDGSVVVSDESELDEVSDSGRAEGDEEESADDEEEEDADGSVVVSDESELDEVSDSGPSEGDEEEDDADNGHNSLQSCLIHVLQEPAAAAGRIATASFQLVMTGRALGSVEHPNLGAYEAEKSTEVYDFRTDTWTDSGDLCGNLRLARNSSSAYHEGLVLTVAYGPSAGHGLARAGNPYYLLSYNVASREWSLYTRIVIPGSSLDYEQPQILSCDGGIFLVTLYVCPTSEGAGASVAAAAGAADDTPAAGAADGFSHQLVIHEFTPSTLEFARVCREPFTYICPEEYRELPKCVGTSEGKICCGLAERALAYYDLREEKWTEYPEFEKDEDEEEIRYAGVCYKPSLTARVHW